MRIEPNASCMAATIHDIDLSQPLSHEDYKAIEQALGGYGVISFPQQNLSPRQQRDFAANFGTLEINVANMFHDAQYPEVMILSNIVENGKPVGLSDAGQDWHTDMSYNKTIAF